MSGPAIPASSAAAKAVEEALVGGDDAGDVLCPRGWIPFVDLECAAEDDSVGAREHVAEVAERRVTNLRLRLEDGELAARRVQVLVVEQLAAAKAGAVEDQLFGKPGDIGRRGEAPNFDVAAGDLDVAQHLSKITPGLDVHRVVPPHAVERERMLGPPDDAI